MSTWEVSQSVNELLKAKLASRLQRKLDIILARVYICHWWTQQTKNLILYFFFFFSFWITLTFEAWPPLPVTA